MTIDELVRLPEEAAAQQLAKIAVENRKQAAMPAWVDGLMSKLRAGDIGTTAGLGAGALGAYGLAREVMKPKEDRQFGNVAYDAALGGTLGAAAPLMAQAFSNSPSAAKPQAPSAVPADVAKGMQPGAAQPSAIGQAVDRVRENVIAPLKQNVVDPAINWFGPQTRPAALGGALSAGLAAGRAIVPRGDSSALQAGYNAVQSGKAQFPIPTPAGAGLDPAEYAKRVQADMGLAFGDLNRRSAIGRHFAATDNARKGLHFSQPAPGGGMTRQYVGGNQTAAQEFSRRLMDVGHQQPRGRLGSALTALPAIGGAGYSIYKALTQ